MTRTLAVLAAVALATGVALMPLAARPDVPKVDAPKPGEEHAVHKLLDDYAAAYSKGDPQAVAAFFTTDAEYIKDDGQALHGSEAIRKALEQLFTNSKGLKLETKMISCRPLVPDACSVQIAATVKLPDGGTTTTQSRLIVTKRNNEWLIAEAREGNETASAAESSAPLDTLAWMIGEWVDTSDRVDVRISCDWFANKHFLVRSFSVTTDGQMDLQGTEILGYDPTTKQIRSWVFDSDGSFSEGMWTQQGKTWSESMKGTLADGRRASAIHTFTRADANSYVFSSTNREVGGQVQPSITEIKMVRQTSGETGRNGKDQ
jgi:uncharacterized protein (TIGR02246 family)